MGLSSKQIILDTINLKETSRKPAALLSGGAWTLNRKGITLEKALSLGGEQIAEIMAETNELIKSDIVWVGSGYHNLAIRAIGGNIKFRTKGTPDVLESVLKNASDIGNISFNGLREDKDINVLWDTGKYLSREIGDQYLVGASQWGPFTLAALAYGVENLMRNIYKDKEAVHAVLEFASELSFRYLEGFIDSGVGIVSIADPTASGDMISRQQFESFALPYLKKLIKRVKARGVEACIHICGDITNRLDLIAESGASFISLDYKVDLGKARDILKGKMAFAGNMNPVGIMQFQSVEGVKAACIDCIEKAGPDSSHILMPGCDIPPGVPIENIKTMVNTAWNYDSNTFAL